MRRPALHTSGILCWEQAILEGGVIAHHGENERSWLFKQAGRLVKTLFQTESAFSVRAALRRLETTTTTPHRILHKRLFLLSVKLRSARVSSKNRNGKFVKLAGHCFTHLRRVSDFVLYIVACSERLFCKWSKWYGMVPVIAEACFKPSLFWRPRVCQKRATKGCYTTIAFHTSESCLITLSLSRMVRLRTTRTPLKLMWKETPIKKDWKGCSCCFASEILRLDFLWFLCVRSSETGNGFHTR